MPRPKRKAKKKGKIKFRASTKLVHRNDATHVANKDSLGMRKITGQPPADVAPTFKVKIRKK